MVHYCSPRTKGNVTLLGQSILRQYSTYYCEYFIRELLNLTYTIRNLSVTVSSVFTLEKIIFFVVVSQFDPFARFLLRTGIQSRGINQRISEALHVTKVKRGLES